MSKKLMRKKLAMMLATLKKKRKFFCEVEYLKSDGLSLMYITPDLSYFPDFEVGVKCDSNSDRNATLGVDGNNMLERFSASNPYWTLHASGTIFVSNVGVGTYADAKYKDGVFSVNGVTVGTKENTFQSGTLCLFKPHTGNNNLYKMSIYFFKAWDSSGNLVRDFIPVLDWDMTPCMYDRVTEQLFYNQGKGSFVAGRQIHPVDYLESTGTQYIDTGIEGKDGITAETRIQRTSNSTNECFVGAYNTVNRLWLVYTFGGQWYRGYNTTAGGWTPSTPITDWYTVKSSIPSTGTVVFDCNGTSISSTYTTGFNTGVNVQLFQMGNTGTNHYPAKGKMSYCKLYDYGVLVRDFIPAISEDGTAFMFDRVSHTCFLNAGTGQFSYPAREVEYLTSNGNQYIDTGIQPTDDYGYKIRNTYTRGGGEQCAIGCMDAGNRFVGIYTSGAENQLSGAWGSFVGFLPNYPWTTGTILDVEVNYKNSRKMIVGGTELKDISDIHVSGTVSNTIYLFARHYGSTITKMKGNVYGVEITNGQNVVADFIPAFKDGQVGMYDKVSGVLKTNTGIGSFSVGRILEPEYE